MSDFVPIIAKCKNCKDTVTLSYIRQLKACHCFANKENSTGFAIDAGDGYYYRVLGNIDAIKWVQAPDIR